MATPFAFEHERQPRECGARHFADGRLDWTLLVEKREERARFRISASMESVAKGSEDKAVARVARGEPSGATQSAELALKVRKRFAAEGEFSLDVAFSAACGFTILFGASGAGKTTLLDCIAGLVRPDAGVIRLGERLFFDDAAKVDVKVSRRNVG
jgi:ABC-type glutathione transport system ATPase component